MQYNMIKLCLFKKPLSFILVKHIMVFRGGYSYGKTYR